MQELAMIGLDIEGKNIICENPVSSAIFSLQVDDQLRAAVRGDLLHSGKVTRNFEVRSVLSPKDIQARIRAGASVAQLAESSGMDILKIERFAHPVLLERQRAAELATAAHPLLSDGPAVETLGDTVASALVSRGLDLNSVTWDAWRNDDSRWTVHMSWRAGRSENKAHFRFTPGAHGGTVTALDDAAHELIDPGFERPLRPVAAVAQLEFDTTGVDTTEQCSPTSNTAQAELSQGTRSTKSAARATKAKRKPAVPGWEDVLLGVRSSGQ